MTIEFSVGLVLGVPLVDARSALVRDGKLTRYAASQWVDDGQDPRMDLHEWAKAVVACNGDAPGPRPGVCALGNLYDSPPTDFAFGIRLTACGDQAAVEASLDALDLASTALQAAGVAAPIRCWAVLEVT